MAVPELELEHPWWMASVGIETDGVDADIVETLATLAASVDNMPQ